MATKEKNKQFYPQQEQALIAMDKWLHSTTKEFCLSGSAGTGKSYILDYFIQHIALGKTIVVTAPTHKALRNIEQMTGKRGRTLHALHGLKPNVSLESFSIDNMAFTTDLGKTPDIVNYDIVIIDECSMIGEDLYNLNLQRANTYNVKLLYVGDRLQLPPVRRNREDTSASLCFKCSGYNLTEIVRQEEGNPLLELFSILREDVDKRTSKFLDYIKTNRGEFTEQGGYKLMGERVFSETIVNRFNSQTFAKDQTFIRGACYTNQCVGLRNQQVRKVLLENPNDIIVEGDLLTAYINLYDENMSPLIINSEDYGVDYCRPYVNDLGFRTYNVNLISASNVKLSRTFQIVDHRHKESFDTWLQIANYMYNNALSATDKQERKTAWFKWFSYQNKYLTMIDVPLFNKHTYSKAIDYGFFLSIHKLQGSTLTNVAIDMGDVYYPISKSGKPYSVDMNMANRLMYVALSRAKKYAIIKF